MIMSELEARGPEEHERARELVKKSLVLGVDD
jgi:hypothetical protein